MIEGVLGEKGEREGDARKLHGEMGATEEVYGYHQKIQRDAQHTVYLLCSGQDPA